MFTDLTRTRSSRQDTVGSLETSIRILFLFEFSLSASTK